MVLIISGCVLTASCYVAALVLAYGYIEKEGIIKTASQSDDVISQESFEKEIAEIIQEDIERIKKENNETQEDEAGKKGSSSGKEKASKKESSKEVISKEESSKEELVIQNDEADRKKTPVVSAAQTVQQAEIATTTVSDVTEVVKAAMPSVVAITNQYSTYDYWGDDMIEESNGSGIIISQNEEELLIVTNYHVIENSDNITVKFIDGTEVQACVKGTEADSDLAVLSVFLEDIQNATLKEIAIAVLGESELLEVGEPAIAIGNSLGYGQSVTTGVISAVNREIYANEDNKEGKVSHFIQTDAAINPGNSGGALLNVRGEVIGINSNKIADYVIEGMGYAIPISSAKPIIDELVQKETKKKVPEEERAFLGISGTDVSEEAIERYGMPEGVYISSVIENSAAEKYGLRMGDIITHIDGERVYKMTEIQGAMEYYSSGSKIIISIMRNSIGQYNGTDVEIVLGKRS